MINNWRLTAEVIAYIIPGTDELYLAAPEKKIYQQSVLKEITDGVFSEYRLELNEFNISLRANFETESVDVYIKSDLLPKSKEWYRVKNFYEPHTSLILSAVKNDCGDFSGTIFESAFSEDDLRKVTFTTTEMPNYNTCFQEMRRRMNCELYKKTKKWIPGHRYDSLKDTFYYLGSAYSHKKEEYNSEFIKDITEMPEVYFYVTKLKPEEKTISDVFNNRHFGDTEDDIQITNTMISLVDSGEELFNDFGEDIQVFWDKLWENSIKANKEISKYNYVSYKNPKYILDILAYQSHGNLKYSDDIKQKTSDLLCDLVSDCIINNWGREKHRKDIVVSSNNTIDQNVENGTRLFYSVFKDPNVIKNLYYSGLFNELGISLQTIVRNFLLSWSENKTSEDIYAFLKYRNYHEDRVVHDKVRSTQRINSTNYKMEQKTLNDIFSNTDLKDTIIKVIEEARKNCGYGVSEFSIQNVGTKRMPKEYIACRVTIDDIINYYKGLDKMPENLIHEILVNKFCWVDVTFDKDGELK